MSVRHHFDAKGQCCAATWWDGAALYVVVPGPVTQWGPPALWEGFVGVRDRAVFGNDVLHSREAPWDALFIHEPDGGGLYWSAPTRAGSLSACIEFTRLRAAMIFARHATADAAEATFARMQSTKQRFRGRTGLLTAAHGGDARSLVTLQQRLDMIDGAEADTILAFERVRDLVDSMLNYARGAASGVVRVLRDVLTSQNFVPQWVTELRGERAARREQRLELDRKRHSAIDRYAAKKVREAMLAADFRTAKHGHQLIVEPCYEHEAPSATSWTVQVPGETVSKAYAKKGFFVTNSVHHLCVNRRALEVLDLNGEVIVYLAKDRRVRQGKGISLVLETAHATERGVKWVSMF